MIFSKQRLLPFFVSASLHTELVVQSTRGEVGMVEVGEGRAMAEQGENMQGGVRGEGE